MLATNASMLLERCSVSLVRFSGRTKGYHAGLPSFSSGEELHWLARVS